MNCSQCNKSVNADVKFCPNCGNNLLSNNGKQLEDGQEFYINKETSFKKFFFSSDARIGRQEFFFRAFIPLSTMLFLSIALFKLINLLKITFEINTPIILTLYASVAALYVIVFYFITITSIKRFHDINASGLWVIILFLPVLNFIGLIILLFVKSRNENNRYGDTIGIYKLSVKRWIFMFLKIILIVVFMIMFSFINVIIDVKSKHSNSKKDVSVGHIQINKAAHGIKEEQETIEKTYIKISDSIFKKYPLNLQTKCYIDYNNMFSGELFTKSVHHEYRIGLDTRGIKTSLNEAVDFTNISMIKFDNNEIIYYNSSMYDKDIVSSSRLFTIKDGYLFLNNKITLKEIENIYNATSITIKSKATERTVTDDIYGFSSSYVQQTNDLIFLSNSKEELKRQLEECSINIEKELDEKLIKDWLSIVILVFIAVVTYILVFTILPMYLRKIKI